MTKPRTAAHSAILPIGCLLLLLSACAEKSAKDPATAASSAPLTEYSVDHFLDVDEAFEVAIHAGDSGVELVWTIAPDYYLYKRKFDVSQAGEPDNELTSKTQFSKGIKKTDEYFGRVEVFYNQAIGRIDNEHLRNRDLPSEITVKYQGCAESGLCYPVQTRVLSLANTQNDSLGLPRTQFPSQVKLP